MTKEKVTLYLQNNVDADIPVALFGNPDEMDNAGALPLYKWNLTDLSFANSNVTSLSLLYRPTAGSAFQSYSYTGNITSFQMLLDILNNLGLSTFYQLFANGYTYLATSTPNYVYNNLTLNPATAYAFTFDTDVSLNASAGVTLVFSVATNLTIDWGDGTVQTFTGQTGTVAYMHNYTAVTPFPPSTIKTAVFTIAMANQITSITATANGNIDTFGNVSGFPALTTFVCASNNISDFGSLPATITNFNCSINFLTSAEINAALIALDGFGLLAGTFNSVGQFTTGGAPPTGAGITAKNNLIGKGWTVTTD